MRKISRYTKLLIASTLLTASFGLTTEAVRSQPYPSTHYSQGIADASEERADRARIRGDNYMSRHSYNGYRQAAIEYSNAVNDYNNCLGISYSQKVDRELQYVTAQLNSLTGGFIPQ